MTPKKTKTILQGTNLVGQASPAASVEQASGLLEPGPLDADIVWLFDLTKEVGIWSHDAAHSSILIHGNHLYLNTGTGVDNTHKRIRTPEAPRFYGKKNEMDPFDAGKLDAAELKAVVAFLRGQGPVKVPGTASSKP